ncbi:MAG: response regulator, partial [Campylobacterota bacterium]|nr:response regulator [Campylobacterota bacterium]
MKIEELYNISNSLTILYVEDNEIIGLKVLEYLSKIFRDVVWEKDGISGFNKFKSQDFDIVVTDIYIPKLDGIEMLKKIKEIKPTQSCVIISEYKEPNCFIESIKLGVDEYILKPIEYEQMNKSFETLLSKINQTKLVQQYQTNLEQLIQEQTNDLMLFKKAIDSTAEGVVIT